MIGNIGSVPSLQCGIPLGIIIPKDVLCQAPELYAGRGRVEEAFGSCLFDGTRRHREVQPWLGNHTCAFRIYRRMMLWHPEAASPFHPAPQDIQPLRAVSRQSYLYFKPPVALFSEATRNRWGIRDDQMIDQVRFAENEGEEQRFADMRSWVRHAINVEFHPAALVQW